MVNRMLQRSDIERLRIDNLSISASLLVQAAKQRGLTFRVLPEKLVELSDGTNRYFFRATTTPDIRVVASWIAGNKYVSRQLLREAGLPTPRTVTVRNPAAWRKVVQSKLQYPLVVKPVIGSHGLGATMNITRPTELKHAITRAFNYMNKRKVGNRVLVEEFHAGDDLRLLVVDGVTVSVVKREPAYVIGDGTHTILELIKDFNKRWQSKLAYDLPMCPIPIDAETTRRLSSEKLTYQTIPAPEQKVSVRWNANVSTGGRTQDVTDIIHPSFKQLAVACAKLVGLEVAGVDVLSLDYTKAVSATRAVVLEINDSPGFDINQLPSIGEGRNVANAILNTVLKHPMPIPAGITSTPLLKF